MLKTSLNIARTSDRKGDRTQTAVAVQRVIDQSRYINNISYTVVIDGLVYDNLEPEQAIQKLVHHINTISPGSPVTKTKRKKS